MKLCRVAASGYIPQVIPAVLSGFDNGLKLLHLGHDSWVVRRKTTAQTRKDLNRISAMSILDEPAWRFREEEYHEEDDQHRDTHEAEWKSPSEDGAFGPDTKVQPACEDDTGKVGSEDKRKGRPAVVCL